MPAASTDLWTQGGPATVRQPGRVDGRVVLQFVARVANWQLLASDVLATPGFTTWSGSPPAHRKRRAPWPRLLPTESE